MADLPPAAARQSLTFFCASEKKPAREHFRSPWHSYPHNALLPPEEHVFICAACWELLCILRLPVSTDEIVIIITARARIGLTKLEEHVLVLPV